MREPDWRDRPEQSYEFADMASLPPPHNTSAQPNERQRRRQGTNDLGWIGLADPPMPWHQGINLATVSLLSAPLEAVPAAVSMSGNHAGWPALIAQFYCKGEW